MRTKLTYFLLLISLAMAFTLKAATYLTAFENRNSVRQNVFCFPDLSYNASGIATKTVNGVTMTFNLADETVTLNGTLSGNGQVWYSSFNWMNTTNCYYMISSEYIGGSVTNGSFVIDLSPNGTDNFSDRGTDPRSYHSVYATANLLTSKKLTGTKLTNTKYLRYWLYKASSGTTVFKNFKFRVKVEFGPNGTTTEYVPARRYATVGTAMPVLKLLPKRAGYDFLGYWTAAEGGVQYYAPTGASARKCDLTSARTLYAQWQRRQTVKFDLGAHGTRTGGGALSQSVSLGGAATAPAFSVEDGWRFIGWSDATFDNVQRDMSVTALYETVTEKDRFMVVDLSGGTKATEFPVSYLDSLPSGGWTDEYKTDKLVLRKIPAGTFMMGSPTDQLGRYNNGVETQHQVTLTKDYYVSVFELTQRQWELVMGTNPSFFTNRICSATRPADTLSYEMIRGAFAGSLWPQSHAVDKESFMGKLRMKTGLSGFDLPTSAQWEYACRAGTTTALNSGRNLLSATEDVGMGQIGRYGYNSGYFRTANSSDSVAVYVPDGYGATDTTQGTAGVGSYVPNNWGIYDMHGNVWEWCLDWLSTNVTSIAVSDPTGNMCGDEMTPARGDPSLATVFRTRRGGAHDNLARQCTSTYAWGHGTSCNGICTFGLRVAYHPQVDKEDARIVRVVKIPAGTNAGNDPDAGAYSLTLGDGFEIGETLVSYAQWNAVYLWATNHGYRFDNPGAGKGNDHPVHSISWYDSVKWCNALSEMEGRYPAYTVDGEVYRDGVAQPHVDLTRGGYRLVSTNEWQYCARGGLVGKRFPWGDVISHEDANYAAKKVPALAWDVSETSGYHPRYQIGIQPYTSPVKAFAANGYGLYDMAGNLWEYCQSDSEGDRGHAVCGGCYGSHAANAVLANVNWENSTPLMFFGFRVCAQAVPPVLANMTALQRYPWNGLVDIAFTSEGVPVFADEVVLTAMDVSGGTNVPIRTVHFPSQRFDGSCHLIWDAQNDLGKGVFEQLCVQVSLVGMDGAHATSPVFCVDLRGLGPWERRVARPTEMISYSTAWATNAPADAKAVVKVYPCLKEKPTYVAIDLSGGANATHYPVEYFNEIPGGSWSDEYKTSKLVLRHIPAGSFIMGGRNTDYPGAVNTNLHMVTLTRDFYMGVFEVTQRQWELVMGNRPSAFSNETCYATRPVELISWNMVRGADDRNRLTFSTEKTFLGRLRLKTQLSGWDVPSNAQWEYACRAGTATALNSGKNLSSDRECQELHEVSRNCFNSGWLDQMRVWSTYFSLGDTSRGTAEVGSYAPNHLGLYDMHGNVWEFILDNVGCSDSVDPLGWDETSATIGWCGGSYEQTVVYPYVSSSVGFPGEYRSDKAVDRTHRNVGFRLSLQGGDLPNLECPQVLVDAIAPGSCTWSPMMAGSRYLTHETMNGATNKQLLSAWFEVGGPRLSLSANGELVPGVGIAVAGNEPSWTVHYTTDGTEPTTNATAYTGTITLNGTTTVRAVAYNAQGVRSEEASATFTLHDPLGIASAVATPRYPWNGKVDVDVELKGDGESKYLVEVEARDLVGGTNLPVRTVYRDAALIPNPCTLIPAKHRLVWDAAADIAGDFDFNRVAVTVKATGSHLLAYPKTLELSVAGYAGAETLVNVPTLVRLSSAIEGFSYDDFATTNGTDLAFFTEDGRLLPYEIDEWNVGGESLVWVKLPELKKGTKFVAAWGREPADAAREGTSSTVSGAHEVWREYAGVWHMNEASGTAFDSTEHHLDGIPSCGTNTTLEVARAQMIAYANGACGRARVNALGEIYAGNLMLMPAYDGLNLGADFVASGWFMADEVTRYPKLMFRGSTWSDGGWGIEICHGVDNPVSVCGGDNSIYLRGCRLPKDIKEWTAFSFVYSGNRVSLYHNGICLTNNVEIVPATDNGLALAIGATASSRSNCFAGQYDEIRLRGGSLSADRIKADYDMIANREFLSYGDVKGGLERDRN